jgi:hypothetical protein
MNKIIENMYDSLKTLSIPHLEGLLKRVDPPVNKELRDRVSAELQRRKNRRNGDDQCLAMEPPVRRRRI